jgi:hypothetical protein
MTNVTTTRSGTDVTLTAVLGLLEEANEKLRELAGTERGIGHFPDPEVGGPVSGLVSRALRFTLSQTGGAKLSIPVVDPVGGTVRDLVLVDSNHERAVFEAKYSVTDASVWEQVLEALRQEPQVSEVEDLGSEFYIRTVPYHAAAESVRKAVIHSLSPSVIAALVQARHERSSLAPSQDELIEAMLPEDPPPVPSETRLLSARRSAAARIKLLDEFGYYRAEQIAEARSRAANRAALASRWAREGKIFGVDWRGQRLYPAFQFAEDMSPRPAVAAVLAALPRDKMSEWEVALWWTAANGWLDYARPVDLLLEDKPDVADRLAEAAAHLADPSPL